MITAYHRPQSLEEAVQLISRASPVTLPLGGGTLLSHHRGEDIEVVDLQSLGLNGVARHGSMLKLGATATLQQLVESPDCPGALARALKLEAPLNLRNVATLGGTLVSCDGRSGFALVLLALDATIHVSQPISETQHLGEFLAMRDQRPRGFLITGLELPLGPRIEFDCVARTPMDRPIVALALARWPSGRTRLAVGGYGGVPILAMDGTEADGIEAAASNAMHEATDPWGSATYRMDVAATLARRCLTRIDNGSANGR